MQFIDVTADQCHEDGRAIQSPPAMNVTGIKMNVDLIAFINNRQVYLKTGSKIPANGQWFNNIRIDSNVKLESL